MTTLDEIIPDLFAKQHALYLKYKELEQLPTAPISIHTTNGQRVLKDFAWRTTEELVESFHEWERFDETGAAVSRSKAAEELADAMHFFIELLIFAGITPLQCLARCSEMPKAKYLSFDVVYWQAVYRVGLAMHQLRNKPWKQTQVPTDEGKFRTLLLDGWEAMLTIWSEIGLDASDLHDYYMRKNGVNHKRQDQGY